MRKVLAVLLFLPTAVWADVTNGAGGLSPVPLPIPANQVTTTQVPGATEVDTALGILNGFAFTLTNTSGQITYTPSGTNITTTIQGRLLGVQVINAGTTMFTTGASTAFVDIELQCGGGSGGGSAAPGASNGSVGGGGGAGGWLKASHIAVTPSHAYTVSISTGGPATSGGTVGNTASDCTVVIGSTTYTAKGGVGGGFLAAQATIGKVLGGAPTAISTNGDINGAGAPGGLGQLTAASGAAGYGGQGGSSQWGAGGNNVGSNSNGGACTGYGSGGGGSLSGSNASAANGAAGCNGILYVHEYSGS